jgi:hypothetical protein
MRKLNLGAGAYPLEGYENWDRKTGQECFPLDVPDNSIDEIRASHILEHFPYEKCVAVLSEWARALKPGGVLKIAVPNFDYVCRAYAARRTDVNVQGYVMGGHCDADDIHYAIFDRHELSHMLQKAGLWAIRRWKSEGLDSSNLPVSLNLQGEKRKPLPDNLENIIEGCMSVPRLGFQDNFFSWVRALVPLGLAPTRYDGAFWGQCIERVMDQAVKNGKQWVLTCDYDSVFTREHVERLITLALEHPEADAICPIQVKRGSGGGRPLLTMKGADGKACETVTMEQLEEPLLPIATGHFGLTMIRTEKLKKMPHPWFLGVPNEQGEWGEGRVDDDIYFWKQWEKAGNSLYVATHVTVGHMQAMISWPDMEFAEIHQYPEDFNKYGMCPGIWE